MQETVEAHIRKIGVLDFHCLGLDGGITSWVVKDVPHFLHRLDIRDHELLIRSVGEAPLILDPGRKISLHHGDGPLSVRNLLRLKIEHLEFLRNILHVAEVKVIVLLEYEVGFPRCGFEVDVASAVDF